MNAQTNIKNIPHTPVEDGADACPAVVIGRQLEAVLAEEFALDDVVRVDADGIDRDYARLLQNELSNRADALCVQLEWVKATSVAGVLYQFVELGRILEQEKDEPDTDSRVARLKALIYDSLVEIGDVSPVVPDYRHGLDLVCGAGPFAEVLQRHTGIDVRVERLNFGTRA